MIDYHLRQYLLNDSNIASYIGGDGLYALRLPQATTATSIVYGVNGGHSVPQLGSMEAVLRFEVTLYVYSASYLQMRTLSDLVDQRLNGMTGPMGFYDVTSSTINSSINTYEEELKLYRNIINLTIYTN